MIDNVENWVSVVKDDIPFDNEIVRCKYLSKEFDGYCIAYRIELFGMQVPITRWYNRNGELARIGFWRRDPTIKINRFDLLDLDD